MILWSWVAVGWLLVIAACDFKFRLIKNGLIIFGLLIALGWLQWIELTSTILGLAFAGVAFLPFYSMRVMGAGDVKFAMVMGAWFGLSHQLLQIWIGGSLLAGLHALVVVVGRSVCRSQRFHALLAFLRIPLKIGLNQELEGVAGVEAMVSRQRIQRTIPYAGYLALAALYLIWKKGLPIG